MMLQKMLWMFLFLFYSKNFTVLLDYAGTDFKLRFSLTEKHHLPPAYRWCIQ